MSTRVDEEKGWTTVPVKKRKTPRGQEDENYPPDTRSAKKAAKNVEDRNVHSFFISNEPPKKSGGKGKNAPLSPPKSAPSRVSSEPMSVAARKSSVPNSPNRRRSSGVNDKLSTSQGSGGGEVSALMEIRWRHWSQLVGALDGMIKNLHETCECERSTEACEYVIHFLDVRLRDFKALKESLEAEHGYREGSKKGLAWDIPKLPFFGEKRAGVSRSLSQESAGGSPTRSPPRGTSSGPAHFATVSTTNAEAPKPTQPKPAQPKPSQGGTWVEKVKSISPTPPAAKVPAGVQQPRPTSNLTTALAQAAPSHPAVTPANNHGGNQQALQTPLQQLVEPPVIKRSPMRQLKFDEPPVSGEASAPSVGSNGSPSSTPRPIPLGPLDTSRPPPASGFVDSDDDDLPAVPLSTQSGVSVRYDQDEIDLLDGSGADMDAEAKGELNVSGKSEEDGLGRGSPWDMTRDNRAWGDRSPHKSPSMQLHKKLSSPPKKKSPQEAKRNLEDKQKGAEARRAQMKEEKLKSVVQNKERSRNNLERREQKSKKIAVSVDEKQQRANANRQSVLDERVKKAHEEDKKVEEVNFIHQMTTKDKQQEYEQKQQERERRQQEHEEAKKKKREEAKEKERQVVAEVVKRKCLACHADLPTAEAVETHIATAKHKKTLKRAAEKNPDLKNNCIVTADVAVARPVAATPVAAAPPSAGAAGPATAGASPAAAEEGDDGEGGDAPGGQSGAAKKKKLRTLRGKIKTAADGYQMVRIPESGGLEMARESRVLKLKVQLEKFTKDANWEDAAFRKLLKEYGNMLRENNDIDKHALRTTETMDLVFDACLGAKRPVAADQTALLDVALYAAVLPENCQYAQRKLLLKVLEEFERQINGQIPEALFTVLARMAAFVCTCLSDIEEPLVRTHLRLFALKSTAEKVLGRLMHVTGPLATGAPQWAFVVQSLRFIEMILHSEFIEVREKPVYEVNTTGHFSPKLAIDLMTFVHGLFMRAGPVNTKQDLPELHGSIAPILTSAMQCLNHLSYTNLPSLQEILTTEKIMFFHLIVFSILVGCEKDDDALIGELLLLVGHAALGNAKGQEMLHQGKSPTVLQRLLTNLPFKYFSDSRYKERLFPTLIATCFNNETCERVLREELSPGLIATYLEQQIAATAATPAPSTAASGKSDADAEPAATPSINRYALTNRFPATQLDEALRFFSRK